MLARVNVALLPIQVELALAGIPHTSPVGPALLERTGVRSALAYLRLATAAQRRPGRRRSRRGALPAVPSPARRPARRAARPALDDRRPGPPRGGPPRRAIAHVLAAAGRVTCRSSATRRSRDSPAPSSCAWSATTSAWTARPATWTPQATAASAPATSTTSTHWPSSRCAALIPRRLPTFLREVLALSVPSGTPAVRLSSVHRVKGLEWPCVLLVGAAEGLCPHRLAIGPAALEAERRVWHVAITRAREQLAVVVPVPGASRFVAEMQEAPHAWPARPGPTRRSPRDRRSAAPAHSGQARRASTPSPRTRLIAAVAGVAPAGPGRPAWRGRRHHPVRRAPAHRQRRPPRRPLRLPRHRRRHRRPPRRPRHRRLDAAPRHHPGRRAHPQPASPRPGGPRWQIP